MNPLFLAHIVADFLLQPTWLVEWKKRSTVGLALHSLIHAIIMAICILPASFAIFAYIIIIAALHGLIDSIKLRFQKNSKSVGTEFLLDQLTHFAVIILAVPLVKYPIFWNSGIGRGIGILLFFFSFGMGLLNISAYKYAKIKGIFFVALTFLLFFIPGFLFVYSFCS